ncbi:hypothetical protein MACK_001697 [Theileria orientalis]|uniref:C3H1-type domain-containing protein n=1 Tax=Theileria orientalis TaxID=68886 RepID=A0A976QVI2_THEOR|nr:hypothetical protein MACK_001697 [Theileria orientalis]
MDSFSGSWLDNCLSKGSPGGPFADSSKNDSNFAVYGDDDVPLRAYIESSSSSTTYISENDISKSVSLAENFQNHLCDDDDQWVNTLGTCVNRALEGDFKDHNPNCPQEASSKDSMEEQLNSYFSGTLGNYTPISNVTPLSGPNEGALLESVNDPSESKNWYDDRCFPTGSCSNSPESSVICSNLYNKHVLSSSNVSTDCGVCEFIPSSNTTPSSASQVSDKFKNRTNVDSSMLNGLNTPTNQIVCPISRKSNYSIKDGFTSLTSSFVNSKNLSNSPSYLLGEELIDTQLAGSLLDNLYSGDDIPRSFSGLSDETYREPPYDSISYFNNDLLEEGNDTYYNGMQNKDMDLLFKNMDSMSRVDNVLNKDVSDYNLQPKDFGLDLVSDNSDSFSVDLLNNDAMFSGIDRDNDTDDSEAWDNIMKKLCRTSSLSKYYPTLLDDANQDPTFSSNDLGNADNKDPQKSPEFGITFKNKDNIPSILPDDPNLGFKKTSLCKYWQRGICANDECNFAHGKKELRSTIGVWRTTICHHWKTGVCRVGSDCRHAHGEEELQPKNIPANVLKNKLLNSARKYEFMRKKRNTF